MVEKADFQSPAKAQLARSPSREEFPLFDYRRSRDDLAEPEPEPEATAAQPEPAVEWPPEAIQVMPKGEQEELKQLIKDALRVHGADSPAMDSTKDQLERQFCIELGQLDDVIAAVQAQQQSMRPLTPAGVE